MEKTYHVVWLSVENEQKQKLHQKPEKKNTKHTILEICPLWCHEDTDSPLFRTFLILVKRQRKGGGPCSLHFFVSFPKWGRYKINIHFSGDLPVESPLVIN